jgi:hypothetical protein
VRKERLESLEAVAVFLVPLFVASPLYISGSLAEVPAAYVIFGFLHFEIGS